MAHMHNTRSDCGRVLHPGRTPPGEPALAAVHVCVRACSLVGIGAGAGLDWLMLVFFKEKYCWLVE